MNSLNHYAFGGAAAWRYSTVCGICDIEGCDASAAGWKRFRLAPQPGGTLTYAEARFDSPYGEIRSRWERNDGGIAYTFTIPCNTTAELILPGRPPTLLGPGEHSFA
jgi:alpha-L-rhamnosidase